MPGSQQLAEATDEPVAPGMRDNIKHHLESRRSKHRSGLDTFNIIIDLRISKLEAAAIIILTVILYAGYVGQKIPVGDNLYENGKFLLQYVVNRGDVDRTVASIDTSKTYEYLIE